MDRFSNLVAGGVAEKSHGDEQENQDNNPQKQTMTFIQEMDQALQEVERQCKQQERETATQKTKETLKALRLACEGSNSIGYCNMLPLIEELQENVVTLEKCSEKGEFSLLKENETVF